MSFNITKINYPKTLMFGENYNFSKISVEIDDANLTIDTIDATWLDTQPPFDTMGFYPLQITVTASNKEVATETVQVFVFEKPHDGYHKFAIYRYTDGIRLLSYDCSDNEADTKLYCMNSTITIKEVGSTNGYSGQQGYLFNEETKQWVYDKSMAGHSGYFMQVNFFFKEMLYCNSNIYKEDKETIYYKADKKKENLPMWDKDVEYRYVAEYPDVREFDDTIEAFFVQFGVHNSLKTTYAFGFRKLSDDPLHIKLMPKRSKAPRMEFDNTVEACMLKLENGKWTYEYKWNTLGYIYTIDGLSDSKLGRLALMNSLQETHNLTISVCDINGENGYAIIKGDHNTEGKAAKYRIKNETTGEYDVVHFETSMGQVVGLAEKMEETEALITERYTKEEENALFQTLSDEISEVERVADGLTAHLVSVEEEILDLRGDLDQEVARATADENRLQAELNGLDLEIDAIRGETGILANAKTYTDTKAGEIANRLTQLEGTLTGSSADLESKLTDLSETVEANKTAIETKTTEFGESLNTVEERVGTLEGQMVELSEADERLDDEIQSIKHHFSNKGSDTLIFATRQDFEQAELLPKTGDLIYILDEKKAYIYSSDEFILFDEITTEEDLKDYIKQSEVETALGETDSHLSTEIERAQSIEQTLQASLATLDVEAKENSQATVGLEDSTQAHQTQIDKLAQDRYTEEEVNRLVDEAVEQQMAVLSEVQPEFGRIGHVWLEEIFFED